MKEDLYIFLYWAFVIGLGVASWIGPYVLKKDQSPEGVMRYRRFGYAFAFFFGLLPALTGGWPWALVTIPAAELVMHFWILGRDRAT